MNKLNSLTITQNSEVFLDNRLNELRIITYKRNLDLPQLDFIKLSDSETDLLNFIISNKDKNAVITFIRDKKRGLK